MNIPRSKESLGNYEQASLVGGKVPIGMSVLSGGIWSTVKTGEAAKAWEHE